MARKQQQQQEAARFTPARRKGGDFNPPFQTIELVIDINDMVVKQSKNGTVYAAVELVDPETGWRLYAQLYPPAKKA